MQHWHYLECPGIWRSQKDIVEGTGRCCSTVGKVIEELVAYGTVDRRVPMGKSDPLHVPLEHWDAIALAMGPPILTVNNGSPTTAL